MRTISILSAAITLGLWTYGCSNSSYGNTGFTGNPNAPTPNTPGVVTVNVVAINGAQSFSPNPATLPAGTMIVWHNVNNFTHRVVLNDGSLDTGDLDPGASSQPMAISASGAQYHCAIHPVMIGSINQPTQSTSSSPACEGQYCN